MIAAGLRSARDRARRRKSPTHRGRRGRQSRRVRRPARVRLGLGRAHRRGGHLERRQRLPRPQGKNAARTLLVMGAMAISLFLGVSYLAVHMHAPPERDASRSCRRSRARRFPAASAPPSCTTPSRALTFAILVLAANTSYQGFPRLGAVLARDRFFPRQFVNLGDRLVYSNGIIVLAGARVAADLGFRRGRDRADPPVRDRRLHRLHALAGRDGSLLAAPATIRAGGDARSSTASARWQPAIVALLVIETKFLAGRLGGDRRHPAARRSFYGDQPPLPQGRAAAPRGCRRRRGRAASDERGRALRRVVRRCAAGGPLVRAPDRRRRLPRDPRSRSRTDRGIRPRFRQLTDIRPDLEIITAGGRACRRRDRLPVGAPARRVELRHGRHPGAVPHAARSSRALAGGPSSRSSSAC